MKRTVLAAGALCLSLPVLGATAAVAHTAAPTASCTDTGAVHDGTAARLLKSKAFDGELDRPREQLRHAGTIIRVGVRMRIPDRGQVVALTTALQESRLQNLPFGDRDSLGLFQQRPSQGWGTAQQVQDPAYAATRFYKRLKKVPGWQSLTVAQAAQAVQASAFPDAYAKWEPLATTLQTKLAKSPANRAGSGGLPSGAEAGCGDDDGAPPGPAWKGPVPKDYTVPPSAPKPVRTAIRWGLGQLGTPYQWGGTCRDARGPDPIGRCDCSSLVQQAYAAAGIGLSRTTYLQVHEGRSVDPAKVEAGDLVFARGSAARPDHVGLALGKGLVLNAPRTGQKVRIERLETWRVLAIRRVT